MKNLRVLLLDDSPFFRSWLAKIVRAIPGIHILGGEENPLGTLKFIYKMKPDAIIMDAKACSRFGVDLIKRIGKMTPVPKVIVLASGMCHSCQRKASGSADFFLDKFTEYYKVTEILSHLYHTSDLRVS